MTSETQKKSLLNSVSNAIGTTAQSDTEKKDLQNEIDRAASLVSFQETQARMADIANARAAENQRQESEHASWLAKNVQALLAFLIILITFILYCVIIDNSTLNTFKNSETKDIVIYILGALTTIVTQVVSYYFGSSSGSADKSKTINAITKR